MSPPDRPAAPTPTLSSPAYRRGLTLIRVAYMLAAPLVGFVALLLLGTLLAGGRHASESALGSGMVMVLALAAGGLLLPALVFVRDRGVGSASRTQHAFGAVALIVVVAASIHWLWQLEGASWWERRQIRSQLEALTLTGARPAEPAVVAGVAAGVRVVATFDLARPMRLDERGQRVLAAMQDVQLEAVASDGGVVVTPPFSTVAPPATLEHEGQAWSANGRSELPAGRWHVSRTWWYVGLSSRGDEPCTVPADAAQPHWRDVMQRAAGARWVVRAAGWPTAYPNKRMAPLWEARSVPLDVRTEGPAWLDRFATLPLPTCEQLQARLDAAKARQRLDALIAGTLPPQEAQRELADLMCADDLAPLRAVVAADRWAPHPVYAAAMACSKPGRRAELLALLGPRLIANDNDRAGWCTSLRALHSSRDIDQLRQFTSAGLPVTCPSTRRPDWMEGAGTRADDDRTAEGVARQVQWLRLLGEHQVPLCAAPGGAALLRGAVLASHTEVVAALLDAGCDPAGRADAATVDKPGWSNFSPRLLWLLRQHRAGQREWPAAASERIEAAVTKRMGAPDAAEFNTPFARLGGTVPLHHLAYEVVMQPTLLRAVVDRGARLDAASTAKADVTTPSGAYPAEAGSWFLPLYTQGRLANAGLDATLDVLTPRELATLLNPVDLTTGRAVPLPPMTGQAKSWLAPYLCSRKVVACEAS